MKCRRWWGLGGERGTQEGVVVGLVASRWQGCPCAFVYLACHGSQRTLSAHETVTGKGEWTAIVLQSESELTSETKCETRFHTAT